MTSLRHCEERCAQLERCVALVYNQYGQCYLKSTRRFEYELDEEHGTVGCWRRATPCSLAEHKAPASCRQHISAAFNRNGSIMGGGRIGGGGMSGGTGGNGGRDGGSGGNSSGSVRPTGNSRLASQAALVSTLLKAVEEGSLPFTRGGIEVNQGGPKSPTAILAIPIPPVLHSLLLSLPASHSLPLLLSSCFFPLAPPPLASLSPPEPTKGVNKVMPGVDGTASTPLVRNWRRGERSNSISRHQQHRFMWSMLDRYAGTIRKGARCLGRPRERDPFPTPLVIPTTPTTPMALLAPSHPNLPPTSLQVPGLGWLVRRKRLQLDLP